MSTEACTTSPWVDFQGRSVRRVLQLGRVSGHKQEKEETVKAQIATMNRFCETNDFLVLDRCADENCQNEVPLKDRKEGGRLWRRLAAPDFQAIVVYTVDRWSREPHIFWPEYHYARSQGVRLISATQALDDTTDEGLRLVLPVLLAVGSYEKSQIVKKFASGRHRMLDERYVVDGQEFSYWLGGIVPYGYRQVSLVRRHILIPDEELLPALMVSPAQVIRWIFQWMVEEHLATPRIAERLNDRQIPTHFGLPASSGRRTRGSFSGYWQPAHVGQIIHNPIYRGEHRYAGRAQPVPALVSDAIWWGAQQALRENLAWADRNAKRPYLLRGLIRCASPGCGHTFYGHVAWSGGKQVAGKWYYYCIGHQRKKYLADVRGVQCQCRALIGPEIEADVLREMQWLLDHPRDATERLRLEIEGRKANHAELLAQVDELHAQRAQRADARRIAERALLSGRFSETVYDDRIAEIEADEERLGTEIGGLEGLLAQQHGLEAHIDHARQFLEEMRRQVGRVEDLPFERKRRLVESWVQEIVVYPPKGDAEQAVVLKMLFNDAEAIAARTVADYSRNYFISVALPRAA